MESTLTGSVIVNLRVRMPTLLGLRARIAGALCAVAAWVLGGRLVAEVDPEISFPD